MNQTTSKYPSRSTKKIPFDIQSTGKVPPHALDLEMAVLGALMLEKEALSRVIDIIKPEIFYAPKHKIIFEAILTLFQNSEPIDLLTVTNQLKLMGKLDEVEGPYYIAKLTSQVASAANIEFHARIVAQKYLQRELIQIAGETLRDAYEDTTDVFDLLDRTEQALFSLSETNLRRNYSPMNELVIKTIKRLEEIKGRGDGITGIPSGFRALDQLTAGWQPSSLIIIAARPAMGKTAFVLSVARNAAVLYKKPVAFFSLEMAAIELSQRLICAEAELDAQKVRTGNLEDYEWEQLNAKVGELSKAPLYIDDTPALSLFDLRTKCRRLKAEKNIELVIIDYLQLMRGDVSKSGNREQEIAGISRALKELAKELNVPVIALSQLSRAVESRGGDKKPMLSDLRESGSIEQDADMVIFLYRPEYYGLQTYEDGSSTAGIGEVIIGKQRAGPVGDVRLAFIGKYAKFTNLDGDSDWNRYHSSSSSTSTTSLPTLKPSNRLDSSQDHYTSGTIIIPSKMNQDDDEEFEVPF